MSDNITNTLNKYLKAIYDINDDIYKSLISDETGVPAGVINTPIDYNLGVIASVLQYTVTLYIDLVSQIFLDESEGTYLDLIAHNHIGIVRYTGETDANYITRIQKFILNEKTSPTAIIVAARPFSSVEPIIVEGATDSAFADWTFSDNYTSFQNQTAGAEFDYWIMPAIAIGQDSSAFFFILILENTTEAQVPELLDMLERYVAAGVSYEVQITL